MQEVLVKVYPSKAKLKKEDQLAWKIAEIASDKAPLDDDAVEMVINRIIDNASVEYSFFWTWTCYYGSRNGFGSPKKKGATVFGINSKKFDCEWAAWANGTAVRELDFHDTFLAADYSHPADIIPPILAVAQQSGCDGKSLIKGILTDMKFK